MTAAAAPSVRRPAVPGSERERRARAQNRVRWELLAGLVRKDLKVKYQGSIIGFAWSLMNPLLQLVVYYFIFSKILKNNLPNFTFYLLAGLLPWTMFTTAVSTGVASVTGNAGLVKKVPFPRVVLPLSSVGFAGVNFVLQMAALVVVMIVSGYPLLGLHLLLLVPALVVLLLLSTAFSVATAALNTRYRDTQHIVEILMFALFYLNPVVYQVDLVRRELADTPLGNLFWLYRLNPFSGMTELFQKALYGYDFGPKGGTKLVLAGDGWGYYLETLGYCLVVGLLLLAGAVRLFRRMQADFAEEL